ncbi:MAG TPA: DMT family transporter [Terriglobales bacterium]|nr:DMT family transporter [Terriglobales bacterium]
MSRALKAHLLLVLITFIWGATFVVIKNALAEITPLFFNAVRMLLATACLFLIFWRPILRIEWPTFRSGALVGIFLWAGYEFQTSGLRLTTPSKSGFLTGVSVVLVPVFLALFWRRKINQWTIIGVAAAFIGLVLMTVPGGANAWAEWSSVNSGDLLTLACAVAFAFQIIFLGRATQRYPFEQIAFLQTAVAAVLMFATIPMLETVRVVWSPAVIWAIVTTGILGTAVAFTVQAWAQQFTPATHTALIFTLEPVFAWLVSYIVLHERLGTRAAAGAMLILAGVLVSELKGSPPAANSVEAVA